jgi:hypothetical protein
MQQQVLSAAADLRQGQLSQLPVLLLLLQQQQRILLLAH